MPPALPTSHPAPPRARRRHRGRRPGLGAAALALVAVLALAMPGWGGAAGPGPLHLPSPDWRDQVIYFAVTDRFADGDPRNNDQGTGEYAPGQAEAYQGGDLAGLRRHLAYIQGLGATALWITPPVANQWRVAGSSVTGYHGYWAEHFRRVDRHLGTLADLQALSRALHGRGMYLVQDIVLNHTGDFFSLRTGWDDPEPLRHHAPTPGSLPVAAPSQPPFHLNDPRRAADRAAAIYHWTPDISDYSDPRQLLTGQMSALDDLNTEHPRVRRALRDSYGWWIRQAGVDALRVDTAFYVPPALFTDFLHSRDPRAPGVLEVARRTGRRDLLVFGEGFAIDAPYREEQSRRIEAYVRGPAGEPLMGGMLNFPLYGTLGDVFARGRPTAELADRIERMLRVHARPHRMPSFVDNHDVDRFLAGGSPAALRQALLALMTLPGIPVIYYGTEQGLTQPRAAMFAAGWGSGGRDRHDTGAPLYRHIAALTALRRAEPVLSRGTPTVLHGNTAAPGAIAWRMDAAAAELPRGHHARTALVVFNTAGHETLLDALATGLPAGTRLHGRHAQQGELDAPGARPQTLTVGADGGLTLRLPPRSAMVWTVTPGDDTAATPPVAAGSGAAPQLVLDPLPARPVHGPLRVSGRLDGMDATGAAGLRLVVDGDLARATPVELAADGRWQAEIDTRRHVDPALRHRVVAWLPGTQAGLAVSATGPLQDGHASAAREFQVEPQWTEVLDVADPPGDDHGPDGRYTYPTDAGWRDHHPMDLRRVRVHTAGTALRIDLTTAGLMRSWNPPNGFDHVAFTVYIELPGRPGGLRTMPLQHAELPGDMVWHRRLRVGGWSNSLYAPDGASATHEGRVITPGARLDVDPVNHTLSLVLDAAALGEPAMLAGARVYVTTWDYDGAYRPLAAEAQPWALGGGDPASGARVMDASAVLTLP
ncbi:MAG: hypothetical protein RLZZ584_862 [Pseudomonadota bacterium]